MDKPFLLETPRLRLREHDPVRDAPHGFELNADPEVTRYTGSGPFASVAEAEVFMEARCAKYAADGFGRWVVEDKATGAWLGWCGLLRLADGSVDLGYRFHRRYWGHGYATEAARACLDYGFGPLGLDRIILLIMPDNVASCRVAEKLGARPVAEREFEGELMLEYELRK